MYDTNIFIPKEKGADAVEPIQIMDDGKGGFNLDLISRKEDTQVQLGDDISELMMLGLR